MFDGRLDKWQEKWHFLAKIKDLFNIKLWTISNALTVDIKKIKNLVLTTITVFTDSQVAIIKIWDPKTKSGRDRIQNLIYQNTQIIKNIRYIIILQWVPGHLKIVRNEKPDTDIKNCTEKKEKQTDYWSLLTQIQSELQQARTIELFI